MAQQLMLMFALKQYIAEYKVACLSATVTASKIIPLTVMLFQCPACVKCGKGHAREEFVEMIEG